MRHRRATRASFRTAKTLRHNPTDQERRLWAVLRGKILEARFRRQHAIGPYIVDFCSPRHKLVIELDGSQHLDQVEYDLERTHYLADQGYRVLRFWNNEVDSDLNGVVKVIQLALTSMK